MHGGLGEVGYNADGMKKQKNLAFIDAQNLYFGTTKCARCAQRLSKDLRDMRFADCTCGVAWKIDLEKLRVYLTDKYHVTEAYYFLGYVHNENTDLYQTIQRSGFIVVFKEHHADAKSSKKGNIDTDLVLEVMKNVADRSPEFDKILLISGDGDYKKLVDYLINKGRFVKILFPNKEFSSSLFKSLGSEFFDYLPNIKSYIEKIEVKEKGS